MMQLKGRRRIFVGVIASVLITTLAACGSSTSSSTASSTAPSSTATTTASPASPDAVLRLVAAAPRITTLPTDLKPPLQDAANDSGFAMLGPRNCEPGYSATSVSISNCTFGNANGSHTIVILGDSHAAMWLPAFDLIGKRLGWRVIDFNKVNCGAASLEYYLHQQDRPYTECDSWHKWVINEINSLDPSIVVLTSLVIPGNVVASPLTPQAWTTGLDQTLGQINSPGTHKVVLGDIPYLIPGPTANTGWSVSNPPDCLAAHESNVQACSVSVSQAELANYHGAEATAAQNGGAQYIDVIPWLCSSVCTAVIGNMTVYENIQHITATYSRYLSGTLQASLEPDLAGPSAK
jgi:hypothetical protein